MVGSSETIGVCSKIKPGVIIVLQLRWSWVLKYLTVKISPKLLVPGPDLLQKILAEHNPSHDIGEQLSSDSVQHTHWLNFGMH